MSGFIHPESHSIVCQQCNHVNTAESVRCEKCATPLPSGDQTITTGGAGATGVTIAATKQLSQGALLGDRYEIVRLLGQGGMGTIYEAYDRELDRKLALKVIRADMAASPDAFKRFKQEVNLARQITHRNVIRIFDLGQAEGIKFITMEYIEGEDLQHILAKKKKLTAHEAANIIAQVCRALEAAHAEGVIHRDLKPQNIMLDSSGRVYVMDFGIARSMLASGMTHTGAVIGTPDYMSPEQAKGLPLDARSDLFAVGIIFYELLSGHTPFSADTAIAKLWKRTAEPARPLGEIDKNIPQPLSDIVKKCLEIDPQKRFASASELLQQIEMWQGPQGGTRVVWSRSARTPLYVKWVGAGLALVLVGIAIALRSGFGTRPAAPHTSVSLLIADFDNNTGDSVFDETLEPMLSVALEGAPFISSYNRGQAKKVAFRLRPGVARMDGPLAELVAVREGISAVVAGSIAQDGNGYRVSIAMLDPITNKPIVKPQDVYASNKQDVLSAAGKLADRIRKGLGDTTPESARQSAAETYTTASLEAAHAYAVAQDLQLAGKWQEAIRAYSHAIELDPNMGRAYAGIAVMYNNLGKRQEAEKNYELAMQRIDRMTEREKYRTRSAYYLVMRNQVKAIEELASLVKLYPADTSGHANLALAYFYQRDMTKALEEQKRALEITPHSVQQRSNFSQYALYAGDFDTAAREAQQLLRDSPKFEEASRTLALVKLATGKVPEAKQEYAKLQAMSARGATIAGTGLADVALYEGRFSEAQSRLEKNIAAELEAKDPDGAANDQATLALTQAALNRTHEAQATAVKAAGNSKDIGVLYRAAQVYIAAGQDDRVMQTATSLGQRLDNEPHMYAKLILGEMQLKNGNTREALTVFQEAQQLSDSWLGHFDLARAYLDAGRFTEASSELDVCWNRRGEATSVFLDDNPTYHMFPVVYYYQGRAREGLGSPGAAESYKLFLDSKAKDSQDPLVTDLRKRLGGSQ